MKKICLSMILCFCSLLLTTAQSNDLTVLDVNSNAIELDSTALEVHSSTLDENLSTLEENSSTLDVVDSKNFKKWSIELGGSFSIPKGVTEFARSPGNMNAINWKFNNGHRFFNPGADIAVRYMFNNLFGVKLNIGYIDFYNKKKSTIKYDTKQFSAALEGVLNLGRIVHMEEFSKKFNLLLHGGFGATITGSNEYPFRTSQNDHTVILVGGITTQYLLCNSIALQFDLNMQKHYMYNYTLDNQHRGANYGFEGLTGNARLGLAIYLGGADKRDKPHADWYYIKREAVPPAYVPTTPAELLVDTDGDGIPDYLDLCPDEPGLQELRGCPDRDGDGIADFRDRCPDTPGTKEFFGCPDELGIMPLVALRANMAEDVDAIVFFDINKSNIKLVDYHTLYKFVYFVKERQPDAKILVEGHTDITASEAYNMKLSQRRADAVKKFLTKEGISENQISTEAYGKTKPRANNETAAGRSENRRVELKIAE